MQEAGHGDESGGLLESEFEMLTFFCNPADASQDVETKAMMALEQLIPINIAARRQRLIELVRRFREKGDIPPVMLTAPVPLRLAYEALRVNKNRSDAAQDALMRLASSNWKPQAAPEFLPVLHPARQSVPQLRDRTLKQVSLTETQQSVDDLEAFLVVTAVLNAVSDEEMY